MEDNWHKLFSGDDFVKYQYKNSPYRVVAHLNDRGHFEALFTSVYPGNPYLIRGNCGGGPKGKMKALAAAWQFMADHEFGCPPPGKMADGVTA